MPTTPRYPVNRFSAFLLSFCLIAPAANASIIVGSWNIRHIGWNNDKQLDKVAHVAQHFDLLAIQELMNEGALDELEREVERASGESWSSMASHAMGRSTYREHYGFLWRDAAVSYDTGAVVYIDDRDAFAREPFSAQFRSESTGNAYALGSVHITYGDSISDRLPEITALARYWEWLAEVYPDTPRFLAGDFNLRPSHEGWAPLRDVGAMPMITEGATTLGMTEGVWSNLYDNIWHIPGEADITGRGIVPLPDLFSDSHEDVRSGISDHAPIWLALGDASMALTAYQGAPVSAGASPAPAASVESVSGGSCLDLNSASPEALESLPNVGEVRAQSIIDLRPWGGPGELARVKGLGPASVRDILASGLVCP